MSRRERPLSPSDRKLIKRLPMTILFHRMPNQPARLFADQPQLHRLVRAGLVVAGFDASANAVTLSASTKAEQAIASIFVLPPAEALPDPRR